MPELNTTEFNSAEFNAAEVTAAAASPQTGTFVAVWTAGIGGGTF